MSHERDREPKLPLESMRVLDLTSGLPGALASMLLSDYGAETIRVESGDGDWMRGTGAHHIFGRGKRSLRVDLGEDGDVEILERLAKEADVVMVSRGGNLAPLAASQLLDANPSLVHCTLSGWGPKDPRPARSSLIAAGLGLMSQQAGYRDGPLYLGHPGIDYATAYITVISTLAALHYRSATGLGQEIEVSLLDGVLALLTMSWESDRGGVSVHAGGKVDVGRRRLLLDTFECGDGKLLMVHSGAAGAFSRAIKLFGLEGEITDYGDAVEMGRELTKAEQAVLQQRLPGIFKSRSRDDWLRVLWDHELAALPLQRLGEVFDDNQVRHNRLVQTVEDPELGPIEMVSPPVQLNHETVPLERPARRLNEDGDDIRRRG